MKKIFKWKRKRKRIFFEKKFGSRSGSDFFFLNFGSGSGSKFFFLKIFEAEVEVNFFFLILEAEAIFFFEKKNFRSGSDSFQRKILEVETEAFSKSTASKTLDVSAVQSDRRTNRPSDQPTDALV